MIRFSLAVLVLVAAPLTFAAIISPAAVLVVGAAQLALLGFWLVAIGRARRHDVTDVDGRGSEAPT